MPIERYRHEFVETMPDQLEEGTLYISVSFATVLHLCACGCGTETVTRLHPTDYQLTYDGETISLSPSIGNWQYPCRSHYFIQRSEVEWAGDMTDDEVAAGRARSRCTKRVAEHRQLEIAAADDLTRTPPPAPTTEARTLRRLTAWIGKRFRR